MDVIRTDRSLGELFSDLSQQTAELIQQEMRLARRELGEAAAGVGRGAALIGAGAAFALGAIVALAATVTLLLIAAGLAPWLGAALTALLMGGVGYGLAQSGITALKQQTIAPVETMHSLKETAQWLKNPSPR